MKKSITQDTFNEAVQENITEFSMTNDEAVDDAIKQFEAQGVDLSNIMKCAAPEFLPVEDRKAIDLAVKNLDTYLAEETTEEDILREMTFVCEMSETSLSHKLYVGKTEFVRIALETVQKKLGNKDIVVAGVKSFITVMTDQPDLLNPFAVLLMTSQIESLTDQSMLQLYLTWMKVCCIKHEENRVNIFEEKVPLNLQKVLENFKDAPAMVCGVCSVIRALVLDDDIRVEFGKAHERARAIADLSLTTLVQLLKKYKFDQETIGELLLTLCAVIVRNEYCEKVAEAVDGCGLKYILKVFVNFPESEKLNRVCMKLLKVLAGSDRVKFEIVEAGAASVVVSSMEKHMCSAQLIAAGNGCISALTLRSPFNSKAFCDAGAPSCVLEGMRTHKLDHSVQKQGCWAIRNIVSRSRNLSPLFLELGAECWLNFVLKSLGDQCEYDAKSALRDLGCHVDFKEEWTGKGLGALN